MARIGGVGAKKLDRYGAAFLGLLAAAPPPRLHPARRKLAGGREAPLYDRLLDVQARLARGADGTGKLMSCSASALARLAAKKPGDLEQISRMIGERHGERFGAAFLEILRDA